VIGLAQAGASRSAGCSPTTVLLIERSRHIPSELVRQRLAAVLGVTEGDIWPAEEPAT
jgi:transcriptional regulator with XRE-family HTH domain